MNLDELNYQFLLIEKKHFAIIHNFIRGKILYEEVKCFEEQLETFRQILYQFKPKEEELFCVANMKSKVQHYNSEVLEDEELLKIAYKNSRLQYIEKL